MGRRRVFILDEADTMKWNVASVFLKILEEPPGSANADTHGALTVFPVADHRFALLAISLRAAAGGRG